MQQGEFQPDSSNCSLTCPEQGGEGMRMKSWLEQVVAISRVHRWKAKKARHKCNLT